MTNFFFHFLFLVKALKKTRRANIVIVFVIKMFKSFLAFLYNARIFHKTASNLVTAKINSFFRSPCSRRVIMPHMLLKYDAKSLKY